MVSRRSFAANDRAFWRTCAARYRGADSLRRFHPGKRPVLFVVLYQLSKGRQRRDADVETLASSHARTRAPISAVFRMAQADRITTVVVGRSGRGMCGLARG